MENETIKKITSRIPKLSRIDKYSIISTFIFGFLSYGYLITNHLINFDALSFQHSSQNMISSGRQFLMYACLPSSTYDLRWLNCVLAMAYIALTSLVLIRLFDVRRPITAVVMSAFMVTFPSVTATMYHSFTVDGYMLAVLFSVWAVYLAKKKWWGFIPGIFLVGFAIGVYQIYYSCTIVLVIIMLMKDLLEEKDFKKILNRVIRYLVMGIGAYAFYVISLKIMLAVQGRALSGHQGTDFVNHFPFDSMGRGLIEAFKSFARFGVASNLLDNTLAAKIAYWTLLFATVVLFVYKFIKSQMYKKWYRVLCMVLLVVALPFGSTTVLIVSPGTYMHALMRTPWSLLFIFALYLGEQSFESGWKGVMTFGMTCLSYLCAFIMILNFAVSSNIAAYNLEQRYERTYALCLRIVDRLEKTEGFSPKDKVAVMGGMPDRGYYPEVCESWPDIGEYFTVCGEYIPSSPASYSFFMRYYIGFTVIVPTDEELREIIDTQEFWDIPKFPDSECIRQINNVWIVKLNG